MRRLNFTGFAVTIGSFFLCLSVVPIEAAPGAAWTGVPEAPVRTDAPAVLVRLAPTVPAAQDTRINMERLATAYGVRAVLAPFQSLSPDGDESSEPLLRIRRLVLEPGVDPAAVAVALSGAPGVEAAWVERRFRVTWSAFGPNDPLYVDGTQWGLRNTGTGPSGGVAGVDIRAEAGWDVTAGSSSTIVAIVDTGLDLGHPELGGTLADGSLRIVRAYNSSVEAPGASAADSVGHGTLVAGVAVARTNNGPVLDGRGVAGVAGGTGGDSAGCRVIAVKATPGRLLDALSTELAEGIIYAVTHGARAINLSFGGDDDDDTMLDAVSYASRRGCVVVCGAGNGLDARPQYPGYYASYGAGISVAALRSDGTLARFSTRGAQVDVAAPGEDIMSTYLTYANAFASPLRNFAASSGTSFAAPFVTGLAGLATGLQPSMIDNEFQQLLRHTARDLGEPGRDDTFGWGIPDAGALLAYAAPPRGFVRGTARAETWALLGTDSVTLNKTRRVVNGCSVDGRYLAERWEVRARVTLPAGRLLETPLGMARTHVSRGWRAGPLLEYDLGYGEVVPGSATADGFTLRAYVYRLAAPPIHCGSNVGAIGWLPSPPESVYFGWSAFGRLDAPPTLAITTPAADGATWSVDEPETLRWQASDPDVVSGFAVELSLDGGVTWQALGGGRLPATTHQLALRSPCGTAGADYRLRVTAFDLDGLADQASVVRRIEPSRACLPGETPGGVPAFALFPVVPNPARGAIALRFSRAGDFVAPGPGGPDVAPIIALYDARGRQLRTLPVPAQATGTVIWDGRDAAGRRMPAGVYLARLRVSGNELTQRFVLLPPRGAPQ